MGLKQSEKIKLALDEGAKHYQRIKSLEKELNKERHKRFKKDVACKVFGISIGFSAFLLDYICEIFQLQHSVGFGPIGMIVLTIGAFLLILGIL